MSIDLYAIPAFYGSFLAFSSYQLRVAASTFKARSPMPDTPPPPLPRRVAWFAAAVLLVATAGISVNEWFSGSRWQTEVARRVARQMLRDDETLRKAIEDARKVIGTINAEREANGEWPIMVNYEWPKGEAVELESRLMSGDNPYSLFR